MYEDSAYFDPHDPNPIPPSFIDSPSQAPTYNDINNDNGFDANVRLDLEDADTTIGLDHQLGFDLEPDLHNHLMPDDINVAPAMETTNWEPTTKQYDTAAATYPNPPYAHTPDLLNLLQLPRCTVGPVFPPATAASISFNCPSLKPATIWADDGSMSYDPPLHLGYVGTQSNVLRDLFHSLPQNYGLFCGLEERDEGGVGVGGAFQEMVDGRQFDGNVMDYRRVEMGGLGKGEVKGNFATERQRREQVNEKYKALRSLVPNPTKADKASVVGDAIEYIKELLRTVDELKILVEKKQHGRERRKILKAEDEAAADMESSSIKPLRDDYNHPLNSVLRSSWLQRRSKESFVDVRIIDDEVNIKLNQKKKPNCLLYIAKVLEELQLDLIHVAGGNIGDNNIFMLNTKICEGSSVYAGAIAKKLLETMDRQYPTLNLSC